MGSLVGIFGGAFDPPHIGHVWIIQNLLKQFAFERIIVVPAGVPPHRPLPKASHEARYEMACLAFAGEPAVCVDKYELEKISPSYTIETLLHFRAHFGPKVNLTLIVGIDAFCGLPTWHLPHEILNMAHVIVIPRAKIDKNEAEQLVHKTLKTLSLDFKKYIPVIDLAPIYPPDVSSTEIRNQIAQQRDVEAFLPKTVSTFIKQRKIYL